MGIPEFQGVIQALGWTLVHFLWQGAIIGLLFGAAMHLTASANSWLRYRLGLVFLIIAGLMPVATFWMVFEAAGGPAIALGVTGMAVQAGAVEAAEGGTWLLALERALEPHLAWAVAFWLAGVIVMSGRVCLDWWQVRRLTWVGVSPLPAPWPARVAELIRTFGVARPVRVVSSTIVRVPAVIGWLQPVVLIPTAALAGLSPRQLELIIAHELAHIHRADYLVNLIQVVIETVLFYHPAVRWMSNRVRQERELCCDDAVIATCGDTLTYAQALTELEVQRQAGFRTALAASGGHLSQRIYRMLDRPVPRRNTLVWSMSLVIGLAAGSMALAAQFALTGNPAAETPSAPRAASSTQGQAPGQPALAREEPATTAPGDERNNETGPSPEPAERPAAAAESPPAAVPSPETETAEAAGDGPGSEAETPVEEPSAPTDTSAPSASAAAGPAPERSGAPSRVAGPPSDAGDSVEPDEPSVADTGEREAQAEETAPAGDLLARLDLPEPAGDGADEAEPRIPSLASARRPESRADETPRPEVRGGEPLHVRAPDYPRRARMRGLQGSVAAEFTIDRRGEVRDVKVTESAPAGVFDRAVVEALREWRFEPLTRDGERVARRVSKVFEFNLENKPGTVPELETDECDPLTGTRICRK